MNHLGFRTHRDRLPERSPVCSRCRRFDRDRPDARRCQAFPAGIPRSIWLGDDDHQSPVAGDRGLRFAPMSEDDWDAARDRSDALFTLRERARARDFAARLGVMPYDLIAGLPGVITVRLILGGENRAFTFATNSVTQWWLGSSALPTYGLAKVLAFEPGGNASGATANALLEPGIREFWATLAVDSTIELCDPLGNATIAAVAPLDVADLARPGKSLIVSTDRRGWADLDAVDVDLAYPIESSTRSFLPHGGRIVGCHIPWLDPEIDQIVAYARVEVIKPDRYLSSARDHVRLRPLVPYLWQAVQVGSSLRSGHPTQGDDSASAATVFGIVRTPIAVGAG